MTYITTQHPFTLDERHPADVFEEMSNFFSLYTVAQNSVQQMSLQITAPANLNIENKPKLAKAYQQFIKAVKYSIPDSHILPIKYSNTLSAGELQLMLQHSDMTAVLEGEPMPFYQKVLGVFLPKFEATTSETGLYPEQSPVQALPIPQSMPQPMPSIQQPAVQPTTPTKVAPQSTPMPAPMPISREPIAQPVKPQMPVPPVAESIQPPIQPIFQHPLAVSPKLPKTTVSIKPYRELLTHTIVTQAKQDIQGKAGQNIHQIILKSSDSLTTAVIEAIFASFDPTANARAYDAIDMVSYGLEELRPALAKIGSQLAEDTQFALNAKAKATPQDFAQLAAGQVSGDSIKIGIKNSYANLPEKLQEKASHNDGVPQKPVTHSVENSDLKTHPADNNNSLNITINVHISDDMGERTVKARQFPINFTTQMQKDRHSIKLAIDKPTINKPTGQLFSVIENQGNLAIANISPAIQLLKAGKGIQNGTVLMPNDVLQIGQCQIRFSVGN